MTINYCALVDLRLQVGDFASARSGEVLAC